MLSIHGIGKITERSELKKLSRGDGYVLELSVEAGERTKMGVARDDWYHAHMFFADKDTADQWYEQLTCDRHIDIKFASLEGFQDASNGSSKGRIQIRLYADIRHTVPL